MPELEQPPQPNQETEGKNSPGNNPEIEPKKTTSLADIFSDIKNQIIEGLDKYYFKEGEFIEKAEQGLEQSKDYHKAAAEYIRKLIANSLREPEKFYEHREDPSVLLGSEKLIIDALKRLESKGQHKEFEKMKQEHLSYHETFELKDLKGKVREERNNDELKQFVSNQFLRDGKKNLIQEIVSNDVIGSLDLNFTTTSLIITDNKTKKKFELNKLLPKDARFIPDDMRKVTETLDTEKKYETKIEIESVDLKSYNGTRGSKGEFAYRGGIVREITYGDLTKKGGILNLLHEIIHAWQNVYYEKSSRDNFNKFYKEMDFELYKISYAQMNFYAGNISKEIFENITKDWINNLKNMGVEMDMETLLQSDRKPGKDEMLSTSLARFSMIIKSQKLTKLLGNYAQEERNAWAHSIRMVRFLRTKGIDLEPEMKNSNDFKDIVRQALDTYQKSVETQIRPISKKTKFVK